jgi:hypothetical protein
MGTIDVQGVVDRMIAIEKESLAGLSPAVTADAVDYFFYAGETFPYLTHRVGTIQVDENSEQRQEYRVPVVARLVVGHITEGYAGQADGVLYRYIPQLLDTFARRQWLQSATYPDVMNRLQYALVSSVSGFSAYQNRGINAVQVGTEFTVTAAFTNHVEQDYI